MAGYNPEAAVSFWQRMSQATGGGSTSWLSTHPSDATRIKQIQGWLPEAQKYYKPKATTTATTTKAKTTTTTKKTSTTTKKSIKK
jgi:predicted Zn-dependent protease